MIIFHKLISKSDFKDRSKIEELQGFSRLKRQFYEIKIKNRFQWLKRNSHKQLLPYTDFPPSSEVRHAFLERQKVRLPQTGNSTQIAPFYHLKKVRFSQETRFKSRCKPFAFMEIHFIPWSESCCKLYSYFDWYRIRICKKTNFLNLPLPTNDRDKLHWDYWFFEIYHIQVVKHNSVLLKV